MKPALKDGSLILCSQSRNFKVNDVVVAFMNGREVVKRITERENGKVFLEGDNKEASTDSRQHGWLVDTKVSGKVIWPRL